MSTNLLFTDQLCLYFFQAPSLLPFITIRTVDIIAILVVLLVGFYVLEIGEVSLGLLDIGV